MTFTTTQAGVLRGMLTAVLIVIATYTAIIRTTDNKTSPSPEDNHSPPPQLALAIKSLILPALCLGLNIGIIARHRFFTPEDIDGGGLATTKGGTPIRILQATLQNTLEQTCLAALVYLCSGVTLPHEWRNIIPAASCLFFIERILFWRGYSYGAPSPALGFALTFYLTMALLLLNVFCLVRGG